MEQKSVSLRQLAKLLTVMADKEVDSANVGAALQEGILADIFDAEARIHGRREYVQVGLGLRLPVRMFRDIKLTNNVRLLRQRLRKVNQVFLHGEHECLNDMWRRVEKLETDTASLVFTTVRDLGFSEDTMYETAREKGLRYGFRSCPPEIGVQLSVQKDQFADWPYGKHFHVMMEPILEEHGGRYFFSSCRTHQPWVEVLNVVSEGPDKGLPLDPDQHLVFLAPKKL